MIPENMSLVPIKPSIAGIRFIHYLKALERFCKQPTIEEVVS